MWVDFTICSVCFYYGVKLFKNTILWPFSSFHFLSFLPLSTSILITEPIHRSLCHHELVPGPSYLFHTCIIKSRSLQSIESRSPNKLNPNINLLEEQAVEVLYWDVWAGRCRAKSIKEEGTPTTTVTQFPQPPAYWKTSLVFLIVLVITLFKNEHCEEKKKDRMIVIVQFHHCPAE